MPRRLYAGQCIAQVLQSTTHAHTHTNSLARALAQTIYPDIVIETAGFVGAFHGQGKRGGECQRIDEAPQHGFVCNLSCSSPTHAPSETHRMYHLRLKKSVV
jgi:hypothetical protein